MGPVLVAVVVIAMIMGLGYWATSGGTQPAPQAPASTPATGGTQPAGGTATAPSTQSSNTTTTKPPADPRAHIDRSGGAAETMKITVYYADGQKNGEVLQPVEMLVPKTASVARAVAENVINAPTDLKLYSNLPAGTKVLGAEVKEGVLTLDLSPEAAKVTGSASVQTMQASLVYSLTAVPGVQKVLVTVNGKTAIFDQLEWSQPLSKADLDARNWFTIAPVIKYVP